MSSNSDNESMASGQATTTFSLEQFSLFLASNLMGRQFLEDKFQEPRIEFYLQWQSRILMPIELQTLKKKPSLNNGDDVKLDLVLFNVNFLFQSDGISLHFGAMTHREQQFYYGMGPKVTLSFLEDHMDQHGVILIDTESSIIASDMAKALEGLNPATSIELDTNDKAVWKIPLHYENEGTSSLVIHDKENALTSLPFNHAFLVLSGADSNFKAVASTERLLKDDTQKLIAHYEEWKQRAKALELEQDNKPSNEPAAPFSPAKSITSPSQTSPGPDEKNLPKKGKNTKAKRQVAGFMRVTNKPKAKKGFFGNKK